MTREEIIKALASSQYDTFVICYEISKTVNMPFAELLKIYANMILEDANNPKALKDFEKEYTRQEGQK